MNISDLTLRRLKEGSEKVQKPEQKPEQEPMREPVKDVSLFFKESLESIDIASLSAEDQYREFLAKNPEEHLKTVEIYETRGLSELYRMCAGEMSEEQRQAFHGIESVRNYLEESNCNCAGKRAKMEEYYQSFVVGNMQSDLFTTIKEKLKLEKITFFYESKNILEV